MCIVTLTNFLVIKGKGRGKIQPRTGHEAPRAGVDVYLYTSFNFGAR